MEIRTTHVRYTLDEVIGALQAGPEESSALAETLKQQKAELVSDGAVPDISVAVLHRLCQDHGINYLLVLSTLINAGVTSEISQKPVPGRSLVTGRLGEQK